MPKNSFGLIGWLIVVFAVVTLGLFAVERTSPGSHSPTLGRIVDLDSDQFTVRIAPIEKADPPKDFQSSKLLTVPADQKDLRATFKSLRRGDLVIYDPRNGPLKDLHVETPEVPGWHRWVTLAGASVLLWLFSLAVLGNGGISKLILGIDGLYSKSKFQLVVWFGVLMVAYLSTLWLRLCYSSNWLIGTVNIPPNLLMLSGFSALSFAGAKAITQTKQDKVAAAVAKGVPGAAALQKQPGLGRVANLVYDLVHDDGANVDLGDFQMVLITLVAAVTYLVQVFIFLHALDLSATVTLPDADGTLLAAFGLGQGAYLLKKAASGSNPDPNPTPPAPAGAGGGGAGGAGGGAGAGAAAVPVVAAAPAAPAAPAALAAPLGVAPQEMPRTRNGVEA